MDNSKSLDTIAKNLNDSKQVQCRACVQDGKITGLLTIGLKAYKIVLRIDKSNRLIAALEIASGQLRPSQVLYLKRLSGQTMLLQSDGRWFLILHDNGGNEIRLIRNLRALLSSISEALRLLTDPTLAQVYLSLDHEQRGGEDR